MSAGSASDLIILWNCPPISIYPPQADGIEVAETPLVFNTEVATIPSLLNAEKADVFKLPISG